MEAVVQTGVSAPPKHEEQRASREAIRQKKDTRGWLNTLLSFASRCRGRMAVAELFSVLSVFSGLVPYYGAYRIIEAVAASPSNTAVPWDAVIFWTAVSAGAYVVNQLLFAASTINSHISAYTISADLREGVAKRMTNASLGTVQSKSIGALKNVVVDRIEQIEIPLAHIVPELSANVLLAVAIAVWLVAIDWRIALACLATLPVGLLIMAFGSAGYYKMYGGYLARQDRVNSVVVEYVEGIRVVKAFNQNSSWRAARCTATCGRPISALRAGLRARMTARQLRLRNRPMLRELQHRKGVMLDDHGVQANFLVGRRAQGPRASQLRGRDDHRHGYLYAHIRGSMGFG